MADFESWLTKIEFEYQKYEFHFAEIFQHLHQYPEIGGEEVETSAYLSDQLAQNTALQKIQQVKNGFISGYSESKKPALCLRGDLDALAIEEKTTLPYISQNRGFMHACGHDFHATTVYAVALLWDKLIGNRPESPIYLFQHSEEPIPGGALDFLEEKAENQFSEIFGFHVEPRLKTGEISLSSGWVNAQSTKFEVTVMGPGGHSARPWESRDPLKCSVDIIQDLYSNLPRFVNIQQPVVFTVTEFSTPNKAYNAIPKSIKWGGTLRVTDEKSGALLKEEIKNCIEKHCLAKDLEFEFNSFTGAPPVFNSQQSIESASEIKNFLLDKNWSFKEFRSLGGEDFGWFSKIRPGFFIRVGITPDGQDAIPLHSSKFKIDFAALKSVAIFYLLYFIFRNNLIDE